MNRFFWGAVGFPALAFGIWLFSWGVRDALWAEESSSWPKAKGHIEQSFVQVTKGRHGFNYNPEISYTYAVNGTAHSGHDIMLGRVWGGKDADRVVNQFPIGATTSISYSPSDPNRALLVPGLHLSEFAYFFLGLTVICFGGCFCVACIFGNASEIDGGSGSTFIPGTIGDRLSSPLLIGTFVSFIAALVVTYL